MFKHKFTGIIYSNRKEACRVMGQGRYKRALRNCEFIFNYEPQEGETVINTVFSNTNK